MTTKLPTEAEKETNAQRLREYFTFHGARKGIENVCRQRANWNACDYIDLGLQTYSENGALCWKQDGKHWCVGAIEVPTQRD